MHRGFCLVPEILFFKSTQQRICTRSVDVLWPIECCQENRIYYFRATTRPTRTTTTTMRPAAAHLPSCRVFADPLWAPISPDAVAPAAPAVGFEPVQVNVEWTHDGGASWSTIVERDAAPYSFSLFNETAKNGGRASRRS